MLAVVIAYEVVRRYRVRPGAGAGRRQLARGPAGADRSRGPDGGARRERPDPAAGTAGRADRAPPAAAGPRRGPALLGSRRRLRLLLCLVRVVTGADELTSFGTLRA